MKKTLLATVAAAWLFTGAMCGSVDLTQLIANAQADAVKICSFVPDAAAIAAIFNTGNAAVQTGSAIAAAICAAVAPPTASSVAPGTRTIPPGATVAGVPISGHFVTK